MISSTERSIRPDARLKEAVTKAEQRVERLLLAALALSVLALAFLLGGVAMAAPPSKPNIVVIWGDDVGFTNLSVYSRGVMGYRTPNIDRIANEGAVFTDHYAHPSCTAGRAAFITGMYPIRTGLTSVGMVGGPAGAGRHARRGAEDPGLRDGAVRQEPSG